VLNRLLNRTANRESTFFINLKAVQRLRGSIPEVQDGMRRPEKKTPEDSWYKETGMARLYGCKKHLQVEQGGQTT
jgi:hypothetical protein